MKQENKTAVAVIVVYGSFASELFYLLTRKFKIMRLNKTEKFMIAFMFAVIAISSIIAISLKKDVKKRYAEIEKREKLIESLKHEIDSICYQ